MRWTRLLAGGALPKLGHVPGSSSVSAKEPRKTAQAYGRALVEALEGQLPKPLKRLDRISMAKFVCSLSASQLEGFIYAIVGVHGEHQESLLQMANLGSPDELTVIDSILAPIHEPSLSKLLLYTEILVCADPILDHPLALRKLVPDHFHGNWPHELPQLQERLLSALEFYQLYAFPIREGAIIPTAWHIAVTLQKTVQNNFLGPSLEDPWTIPDDVASIAEKSFTVRPGTFDGKRLTIHSFDHVPKSKASQIAIMSEGDPEFARCEMETHLRIVDHSERGEEFLVQLAQMPPESDEAFDKWAERSKRKVVFNRMTSLQYDLALATRLGGAVITFSRTNNDILDALAKDFGHEARAVQAATAIATMDLPLIEDLSVNQIMLARKDAEALENFRVGFRKACTAIKSEVGSEKFQTDVNAIARDTVHQGVRELAQAYRALRKKSALDLSFVTAMVVLSCAGVGLGQLQWFPAFLGGVNQFKSILDAISKQDDFRKNPYYMLWNLTRKPFHSGPI